MSNVWAINNAQINNYVFILTNLMTAWKIKLNVIKHDYKCLVKTHKQTLNIVIKRRKQSIIIRTINYSR